MARHLNSARAEPRSYRKKDALATRGRYLRRRDVPALFDEMLARFALEIRARFSDRAGYFAELRAREGEEAFRAAWEAEADRLHADMLEEMRERLETLSFDGTA